MKPPMCAPCATPPPPWLASRNGTTLSRIRYIQSTTRREHAHAHEQRRQEHEHLHVVAREPAQVEAQHARDRAGGPDHRDVRAHVEHRLEQRRGNAGQQVGREEAERAEPILDVVAVDEQEQHVPEEVHEAPVQEHREEEIADVHRRGTEAPLVDEQVVLAHAAEHRRWVGSRRQVLHDRRDVLGHPRVRDISRVVRTSAA